jgi:acyl-coenzyme A synthetase/AMP-(fatty) acid ligase
MSARWEIPTPLAASDPASIVAVGGAGKLTAGKLRGAAAAIAQSLAPPKPGRDQVIVLCRDRAAFAAALFGAWEAGYSVALPPSPQPEVVRALRHRPEIATVLHDGEGPRGVDVAPLLAGARALDTPLTPLAPDRLLVTVYTSGTTGEQRACPKSASQLLGEAALLARTFPDSAGARVVAVVPPHHIYGLLFGVLLPTVTGGSFRRQGPRDADEVARALAGEPLAVLVSVPAHLRGLRVLGQGSLPAVRRVFSSGAPLPQETAEDLAARAGWSVTEVLGSSETGGIAWRVRDAGAAASWQPFDGMRVDADDEGRMLLDSPLLAADTPRPYRGGDRVRLVADGRFEHLGRVDGILKIGSTRVSVAELEARLCAIEGVEDAAVLPVEVGGARGHETWAALVAPGLDSKRVREALSVWLAPVVMPRRYRFVDRLPREPNGKLPREALLRLFEPTAISDDGAAPPLRLDGDPVLTARPRRSDPEGAA